ncbi:addiction module protein [Luteolibacter flavescens]|uniref:Addiction module protein n=1 Tax=Luteolibacter flavescens TaxID=1859460 RepID=A0ABT3FTH5_9BACT|nr:addiction module protein [Luteolibacter flavescens]MCW1886832.1 addiction module protein [Luteolibacter flavescens]
MSQVSDIRQAASRLSLEERAELAVFLLDGLEDAPHHVTDEEALRRRDELVSGAVSGLSREEFRKACGR